MAINRQSQPLLRDRPTAAVMLPMKRGLLVRVGKDQHARALARPDAKPMEMSGRRMEGYVFLDPPPRDERTLRDWLELGVAFVNTLPSKPPRSTPRRAKAE